MPTVPPTYAPISSLSDHGLGVPPMGPAAQFHHLSDELSGPTPDPELDDVVFVAADTGNAVTATHPNQVPAASGHHFKPSLSLGSLVLHSPSSIVGTPFDPSPRFEYPFPEQSEQDDIPMSMSMPNIASLVSFGASSFGAVSSLPPAAMSYTRGESKGISPTHPKLHPREPPVPPGLVKKRRIMKDDAPSTEQHPRRFSMNRRQSAEDRRGTVDRRLSDETAVSDGGGPEDKPGDDALTAKLLDADGGKEQQSALDAFDRAFKTSSEVTLHENLATWFPASTASTSAEVANEHIQEPIEITTKPPVASSLNHSIHPIPDDNICPAIPDTHVVPLPEPMIMPAITLASSSAVPSLAAPESIHAAQHAPTTLVHESP